MLIDLLIFVPAFPFSRVAGAAVLGGLEIPHDQLKSQVVLLAPHQYGTKQGRDLVTPPGPWTNFGPLPMSVDCSLKVLVLHSFLGHSGHGRTNISGSLDSEKWLYIPGFADFRPVVFVTKCHTEKPSQTSRLFRFFFWQYSFSRHLRFMTTG